LDYEIDSQCPKSKSFYGDPLAETILKTSCDLISKNVGLELLPTYSYVRIYEKKEHLVKHLDRPECEYSATLSLGYPENQGISSIYMLKNNGNAKKINLEIGDLCVYRGNTVHHWRDPFVQDWYLQAFLHYVDKNGKYSHRLYDGRYALGTEKIA
jgi:hypothetical protein